MSLKEYQLKVTTSGSAGSAVGSSILTIPKGKLEAVQVDYHASAPSTTDLTIKAPGDPAERTLLTLTDNNSDGWYYPKVQNHDNTGSAITGSYSSPPIQGNLLAELAGADALTDAVVLTFLVDI